MNARLPVAALAVALSIPAAGWPQAELPKPFEETIEVRVVNLDVVVTDRDGLRVPGLRAEDFELRVDGEPVPVEFFGEVRDGSWASGVAQGKPSGVSFLVFIDEFFPLDRDKKRVLEALKERVPGMGPEDQAALVAWDGRNLVMLSDWTSSQEQLVAAIDEAIGREGQGLYRETERRQWLQGVSGATPAFGRRGGWDTRYNLDPQELQYASIYVNQLQATVGAAAAAMRGMTVPTGRKMLLLLAGGWPWDPAQYISGSSARMISEPQIPRGQELYGLIANTANLTGYTVYGVDMPGLQAGTTNDPSRRVGSFDSSFFLEGEVHNSLHFVSEETGGFALINGDRVHALTEVGADAASYYSLGFTPEWHGENQNHQIEIRARDETLRARVRATYPDLDKEEQVAMSVRSSLLFGASKSDNDLMVSIGQPEKEKRKIFNVPVTVTIPVSALTPRETADGYLIELGIFVSALDEGGGRADAPMVPLQYKSAEPPAEDEVITYTMTLQMRKNTAELAVAAYDRNGDRTLSTVVTK